MVGKAVYEGILLELDLAGFFLNLMLGHRNHLHDLQSLDAELYRNVLALKSMPDPSILDLTFSAARTASTPTNGSNRRQEAALVELVPGGANIPVTEDNFVHYIRRLSSLRLNEEFAPQARAFLEGFASIVPTQLLRMFSPKELQLIIAGDDR